MELPAFLLGTAVRIKSRVNVANPTSVTINIKNSSYVDVVPEVAMTQLTSTTYEYIWQTSPVPQLLEDEYDIFITVTSGGYRTIASETISLLDAQNRHNIPDNLK